MENSRQDAKVAKKSNTIINSRTESPKHQKITGSRMKSWLRSAKPIVGFRLDSMFGFLGVLGVLAADLDDNK
jgi:hypothetical protein